MTRTYEKNYINQKINKFTIRDLFYKIDLQGKKRLYALCECSCIAKTIKKVRVDGLNNGSVVSCGCYAKESTKFRNFKKGQDSHKWQGEHGVPKHFFSIIKKSAIKRNLEFSISMQDISNIFYLQGEVCILSGCEVSFFPTSKPTASVDRIDCNFGYIPENIQIVHKRINMLKKTLLNNEFVELCRLAQKYPFVSKYMNGQHLKDQLEKEYWINCVVAHNSICF